MQLRYAVLVLAGLVVPTAGAQSPMEIDILDAYLAGHDRVNGLPHCGRHDGYVIVPGDGPQPLPVEGTNEILIEHKEWHIRHEGSPGSQGSTHDHDGFGDEFVYWHRDFVGAYEAWRAENGHPALEPWDPGTPIPPALAYEFPSRGCVPGRNADPGILLPTWATMDGGTARDPLFGYVRMCDFQDVNQFGKAIAREYHPSVHARLGGDMSMGQGPRDPAFWAFHRFLDDVFLSFESDCALDGSVSISEEGETRSTPMPGAAFALAALGAAWFLRRRSH